MPKLLLVSGDLMVAARIVGAVRKCGFDMVTASALDAAVAACDRDCRVVLVDLRGHEGNFGDFVAALRQQTAAAIIAFAPHVHEQSLAEARAAGCDLVVTRGQLDREAEVILAQFSGT